MPDIRIKDLTTTASTTAADDFFAADGATNGTRKLSAYSPSFGGNATVGGTLTVNGAGTNTLTGTTVLSGSGTVQASLSQSSTGQVGLELIRSGGTSASWVVYVPTGSTDLRFFASSDRMTLTGAGNLSLSSTAASTGTSSGALVVGNGTSGGLGVGGNASIGGTVFFGTGSDVQASRVGAGVLDVRHPSNTTSRLDVTGATSAGIGYRQSGARDWFVSAESNELRTSCLTANSVASYESGVLVRVRDTTASTTTSSGALVVSGGVGVAGAIVTGGIVRCGGSNGLSLGSDTGNIRIDTAGPAGVEFRGLSSADTITGFTMREMALIDGTTAPSTRAGYATIYVDTADGDLKVKFGDGTVKTIATDS